MEKIIMNKWLNPKNLIILFVVILVAYFGVTSMIEKRFSDIEISLREQILVQQSLLTAIAETTARDGADSVTESVVIDCSLSERNSFDNLLGSLDRGLTRTELLELDRLFGRCGPFYSQRKKVMVTRLSREVDIYESYVNLLSVVKGEDLSEKFSVNVWQELVGEEKKQSDLFSQLVTLQDRIISTLIEGKSVSSDEIKNILLEVKEVQDTLVVINTQAGNVRSRLISL